MLNYRDYLSFAEKYSRSAKEEKKTITKTEDLYWLLIPSTILAWTSIESFVNNRLADLSSLPEDIFELHERAFLLEKRIRFIDEGHDIGQFSLEGTEYRRLEDKIFFLIAKFSQKKQKNIKGESLWQDFIDFKEDRDALMHPRVDKMIVLSIEKVDTHIATSKKIIQLLSKQIWGKKIEF